MYCRQHVFHPSTMDRFFAHPRPSPFERGDQGGPNHVVRFSMRALWAEESGSEHRPEEGVTLDLGVTLDQFPAGDKLRFPRQSGHSDHGKTHFICTTFLLTW